MCNDMIKKEISSELIGLSKISVTSVVDTLGIHTFAGVVVDVLQGKNVRRFTEILTRTRLIQSYKELIDFFDILEKNHGIPPHKVLELSKNKLLDSKIPREYKPIYYWLVGLTEKQTQNVLRGNFSKDFDELVEKTTAILQENSSSDKQLDLLYILMVCGAQTLTIRGSEKSLHGKYFEKLILGCICQLLGFKLVNSKEKQDKLQKLFFLSYQDEVNRECDATLIHESRAIKIDIGFIGKGNPEITLDKISRFSKEAEIFGKRVNVKTMVIVDSIGSQSRLYEDAKRVDTSVFCMSESNWLLKLAAEISEVFSINNPFHQIRESQIRGDELWQSQFNNLLLEKIKGMEVPLSDLITL